MFLPLDAIKIIRDIVRFHLHDCELVSELFYNATLLFILGLKVLHKLGHGHFDGQIRACLSANSNLSTLIGSVFELPICFRGFATKYVTRTLLTGAAARIRSIAIKSLCYYYRRYYYAGGCI